MARKNGNGGSRKKNPKAPEAENQDPKQERQEPQESKQEPEAKGGAQEKAGPQRKETKDGVVVNQEAFDEDWRAGKIKYQKTEYNLEQAEENLKKLLNPPKDDPNVRIESGRYVTDDGKPVLQEPDPEKAPGKYTPVDRAAKPVTDKAQLKDIDQDYLTAIENSETFQKALEALKREYDKAYKQPWETSVSLQEPPPVGPQPDYEAMQKAHDAYYANFEARLTALHMNGGYDQRADARAGTFDERMAAREAIVAKDPSKYELDCMMVNQTRHGINFETQLNAHGGDFYNTTFKTKDGQVLPKPDANAPESEWKQYADAVIDLHDRGLLDKPVGPNGKTMDDFSVQDEYTENYAKYQERAAEINAYRCEVEKETVRRCTKEAADAVGNTESPYIAGQKITAITNEQFRADVLASAQDTLEGYERRDYSEGKNPHTEYFASKHIDMSFANEPQHGGLGNDGTTVTITPPSKPGAEVIKDAVSAAPSLPEIPKVPQLGD